MYAFIVRQSLTCKGLGNRTKDAQVANEVELNTTQSKVRAAMCKEILHMCGQNGPVLDAQAPKKKYRPKKLY